MRYISFLMTAFVILAASSSLYSQLLHQPGKIIRRATGAGDAILNPDQNDWITVSDGAIAAYGDDTSALASEIHYRALMPYGGEPCCDLRRGPDHRFSDFVPDNNNNGVYINFINNGTDATSYLRIRMRMGTIIPGSKGFSLLIDTDSAYGNTGARPDPNFKAKTTGINGNPGFEIEVVLETGFRVAIYNVDGKGDPSDGIDNKVMTGNEHLIFYDNDWLSRSQVSFSATSEGGDPDYFIDWYVTLAELKLMKNANGGTSFVNSEYQWLRMIPTTVMAPKPSTAGPVSDIYGSELNTTIENQPKIRLAANEVSGICTVAPVVTSASTSGSNNVKGTWTKGSYGGNSATIYLYKNNDTSNVLTTDPAIITVNSGGTWQATVTGLLSTDVVFAKAKGNSLYESRQCYRSNNILAGSCNTRPGPIVVNAFSSNKGMDGTGYSDNVNGAGSGASGAGINYVHVYKVGSAGTTRLGTLEYPSSYLNRQGNGTVTGRYNLGQASGTWFYSGGSGGPNDGSVTAGQYMYIQETPAGCKSGATFYCRTGTGYGGTTDLPTLTSEGGNIYTTSTTVAGGITAVGIYPSIVRVFLDSVYQGDATVTNPGASNATWSYTFSQELTAGKKVWIRAQATEGATFYCAGQLEKIILATPCSNTAAVFNIDSTTNRIGEGIVLSGTGTPGASLIIKDNGNTTVASLTVKSDGTWSALNSGVTFSDEFTGYARTNDGGYYATLTTPGCLTAATSVGWNVSPKTSESYCSGSLEFSVDANAGLSYNNVVAGGSLTGTKLTSDAKWIRGTLGGSATATSKTIKLYVNDGLVGRQIVPENSLSWPDIYVGGYLAQGDILTIAITENDGLSAEMVCASIQIICDCATDNKPDPPIVNSITSTLTVAPRGKALIKITDPENGNFISVKNKFTGMSLSRGGYYNGGNTTISARFFGSDETLTLEASPVDSTQTAIVIFSRIGGTETCTEETEVPLVVNNALPVNLTDFKGTRNDKSIVLSWTTSMEINFSHFEIERSSDGISFDKIGTKAGSGFLSGPNYYSFSDKAPFYGNNFYRLKMVDIDGRLEYSKVLMFKTNGSSIVINSVRPNPFTTEIKISALFAVEADVKVLLADASGRILQTQNFAGVAGLNELRLGGLGGLPAGVYLINVIAGDEVFRYKVLKIMQ